MAKYLNQRIDPEVFIRRGYDKNQPPEISVHSREVPKPEASYAMDLISRAHLVLIGDQDGEDSAGRAKYKEKPIDSIVTRAFDIAEAAFAVARERGLILTLPSLAEADEMARNRQDVN